MSDGLIDGYSHWLKTDGSRAIWFNKLSSAWLVGSKKNLGNGVILGPDGKDAYPNEIKQGWRFAPGWQDAGPNDIIFKAIGTFFKLSLLKINSTFSSSQNSI